MRHCRKIITAIAITMALTGVSFTASAGVGEYEIYTGFGGLTYTTDNRAIYNAGCTDYGPELEPECSSTLTEADAPHFNNGNGSWDVYTQQDTTLGPTSMYGYVRTTAASYALSCCSGYSLFDVQFATSSPWGVNGVNPDPRANTVLDFTLSGTMETGNPGSQRLELSLVFSAGNPAPLNIVLDNYSVENFNDFVTFKYHGTFDPMTYYRLKILSDAYTTDHKPWDTLTFKLTTSEVESNGDRVSAIYNLDIDGIIYNIYFDQRAGGNLFNGDEAAALAAINAVNDVLNADYDNVDNGHPLTTPMFSVMTNLGTMSAYQSCNISLVPTCDTGDWVTQGVVNGLASDQSAAYFETVVIPMELDARIPNLINNIDPAATSTLVAGLMTTSTATGDAFDFNAADINPDTLSIGPFGATNVPPARLTDLDSDGDNDLRVRYIPAETGIACNDTEISVQAETLGGWPVEGTSSIVTPECETSGCHP